MKFLENYEASFKKFQNMFNNIYIFLKMKIMKFLKIICLKS